MYTEPTTKPLFSRALIYVFAIILVAVFAATILPPRNFPDQYTFVIKEGQGLRQVSANLEKENLIRSRFVFEFLIMIIAGEESVAYGEYYFERPLNSFTLAKQIANKDFNVTYKKVTIPEGYTNSEIAVLLARTYKNFDKTEFEVMTKGKEGYLFPDTYFFFPSAGTAEIVEKLEDNFALKIDMYADDILESGLSKSEIVILASLIEAETNGNDDREMIAGIISNRLRINMALQIDASVRYALSKFTEPLTYADLKVDSPYNTYTNRGLPPGPIGNPGLASIEAALNPSETDYLYYLHDENGTIHYAKTYEGHKQNISKYLK